MSNTELHAQGFQVVTWRHNNVGGTHLICAPGVVDGQFAVVTKPTNWGHGHWGPFPASAILEVRDVRPDDSFSYPGSLHGRWTFADFERHMRQCAAFHRFRWKDVIDRLDELAGAS